MALVRVHPGLGLVSPSEDVFSRSLAWINPNLISADRQAAVSSWSAKVQSMANEAMQDFGKPLPPATAPNSGGMLDKIMQTLRENKTAVYLTAAGMFVLALARKR